MIAAVIGIDGFGNLQLDATQDQLDAELGDVVLIEVDSGLALPASYTRAYADVGQGELLLYEDSAQRLALAVNRGSASDRLGVQAGGRVRISAVRHR